MKPVINSVLAVVLCGGVAAAAASGLDLSQGFNRLQGPGVMLHGAGQSGRMVYTQPRELGNDVYYDFNLGASSLSALFDWHPFNSGFRTTGGLVINGDNGDDNLLPRARFVTGGAFTPPGAGIDLNRSTPYFGIGWGQSMGKENTLCLSVDVGVVVQPGADNQWGVADVGGSPVTFADYLKSGGLTTLIDRLYYSPVVSMGVGFKF
jgi:hypothetical protein